MADLVDVIAILKQEEVGLANLLTIAKIQAEAVKAEDWQRLNTLLQEREEIAARITSLYEDRMKGEKSLSSKEKNGDELVQRREEVARIAKEIIETDQINEQEMSKRMGKIEENLVALKNAKSLKESYLEGIRGGKREAIFINKHQ